MNQNELKQAIQDLKNDDSEINSENSQTILFF